jgi:hypothetical protein
MAVEVPTDADEYSGYEGKVLDTLDMTAELCMCLRLEDAINIARAMNVAEGYRVE